ncbi:MBL fold metallo-hydrolase [Parasphingorhabdus cellanae]|uniref:MBL fold metallo-hydrolase n=1 Tax=Parasphingorhabdus cellanae TaxID=2806553 RepID=A0ABX7T048_9SPHN|nr:MBL fold metallo-hydrolase [Parasphingorhabdus cellanae]QTD54916.1 MBL fold metallo-hydrolase [Parasphingorhabdus cellanae]
MGRSKFFSKRLLLGVAMGIGVLVSATWLLRPAIGAWLFANAVETAVNRDVIGDLPEGMHLALCGTGSPLPDPSRAGPCSAVIIDGKMFIVDIGGGAVRRLGEMGLSPGRIEALLLTHFHSDHIDGMGELLLQRWAGGGHAEPLPVIAPEGVTPIVDGINAAYAADASYRVAHHGEDIMPPSGIGGTARPFALPTDEAEQIVYDQDGLKITAFAVNHEPVVPAVGYRFDYKGRSIVFSGDTTRNVAVERACNGCDILVHEVLNAEMVALTEAAMKKAGRPRLEKIMADIPDYHATPAEVAESAKAAKAKMLVFSHIVPAVPNSLLEPYYLKDVTAGFRGKIVMGKDGMLFSLPADSDHIGRSDLL